MNTKNLIKFASAILAVAGSAAVQAAAAPDPGDYTALPPGTDLALVYGQRITANEVYANGNKVGLPKDLDLKLNLGLFRYVHFTKLGNYTIDPQIIIPYGQQEVGLTGQKSTGIGDIVFGATLWTIADLPGGEHLGYTLFVTAPTGAEKTKGFAISDNRWAADFQVGYIKTFAPKWTIDLIGQAEFYQDRRDTKSEKDPMVRAIIHLRHHLSDATHLGASLRYATGAKETLNGVTFADKKNDTNLTLTWASFVTKQVQLQLQYAKDIKVQSGPKLQTIGVRALYAF
ncbi:transporter [Polaromonas hydrogenivorans]|uniref:Transporter n=1 Tax=Polaromonas hydrogenivorans TaxID=335476 RepID=A0AAU7LRI2_9BURK